MGQKLKLKRSLGLWPLVMLGLGYLTPAVIFDTFGLALRDTQGHVPTAYAMTLFAMLFTAYSYGKMVQVDSSAGSSYSYAHRAIGPNVGFMVGWLSLLDYLLLPMINVLLAQQYLSVIFPLVPQWIWVFVITAVVTGINVRGISSTVNVNSIFVYFQLAVVLGFIVLAVRELLDGMGMGTIASIEPFYNESFEFSSIIKGATILCFSFLGFDAISNYAEESNNPKKDVPRAIMLTAIFGGGLFIVTSYFTQLVFPDITLFKDIENSTAADISFHVGGKFFQVLFLVSSFAGVFASGLASHASVSRLLYVMGRDSMLPKKFFGKLSERYSTPINNIIFVGIISLSAFFFTVETAVFSISFGSLIAFSFVNISVVVSYVVRHRQISTWKHILGNLVMPLIGLGVICVLWFNIKGTAFVLGCTWGLVGLIYLLISKKMKKAALEKEGTLAIEHQKL
jgi:putrescine importer